MIEYKIGDKFGDREYIGGELKKGCYRFLYCKCKCGFEKYVDIQSLKRGRSKGCKECGYKKTGSCKRTHGDTKSLFYRKRRGMISRCNNKNADSYKNYGYRGIHVCDERLCYENFKNDMYEEYLYHCKNFGEKNTQLDRIDNNGNYCKENCKWSTVKEQGNNRRTNIFIELEGNKYTISELSTIYNIGYKKLYNRIVVLKRPIYKALNIINNNENATTTM